MKKNKYTCGTTIHMRCVLLRADVCTHYHWTCIMSSKAHLVCLLCSGGEFYPTEQIRSKMKRKNKRICAATYKVSCTENELRKLICNSIDLIWSRNTHVVTNHLHALLLLMSLQWKQNNAKLRRKEWICAQTMPNAQFQDRTKNDVIFQQLLRT